MKNLSKFMSLVLRHKPETIGIKLDENGYADLAELINGLVKNGMTVDFLDIEEVVNSDNKGRYSFNETKTKIRANQGHSIKLNLELESKVPPEILFHGTSTKAYKIIKDDGLRKMNRHHVHLSEDKDTAYDVGSRYGRPVIIHIYAKKMFEEGIEFYQSENGVWLTNYVNPKYFHSIGLPYDR